MGEPADRCAHVHSLPAVGPETARWASRWTLHGPRSRRFHGHTILRSDQFPNWSSFHIGIQRLRSPRVELQDGYALLDIGAAVRKLPLELGRCGRLWRRIS